MGILDQLRAEAARTKKFLDDAELHLRECVAGHADLVCWRGQLIHDPSKLFSEYETIVVGMTENKESTELPKARFMMVWVSDGVVRLEGFGLDSWIPFGSGHDPLNEVRELAKNLAKL